METSGNPRSEGRRRARIPRWAAPVILPVVFLAAYVVVPWRLSLLSTRHGWANGQPGLWNRLGLVLVTVGTAVVAWCVGLHFARMPKGWELEGTPRYLLLGGPYRVSRNPTFLSVLTIWVGWTLFYGSAAVLAGLCALWAFFARVAIPYEERQLAARFGEGYLRYKRATPRWLGPVG